MHINILLVSVIILLASIYWIFIRKLVREKKELQKEVDKKTKDIQLQVEANRKQCQELKEERNKVVCMNRRIYGVDEEKLKPFNYYQKVDKGDSVTASNGVFKGKMNPQKHCLGAKNNHRREELPPFAKQINGILEAHIDDSSFGVKELSELVGVSKSTLCRKIKLINNITTVEYIREFKMQKALELLKQDKTIRVSEVAFTVGFEDVNYFRDCFKRRFGINPSEVMNQATCEVMIDN